MGGLDLEFLIKEITEPEELAAYQALTQFHYRSRTLYGRTAPIIIRNFHPIYPKVIGYIELTSSFYMNKARSAILNAPFQANNISWEVWDKETGRCYIHIIARIARCVLYPEFRGLGLGQLLLKHAAEFARERWHVAGLKPYFLEISADMLKFVPFAQKAGVQLVITVPEPYGAALAHRMRCRMTLGVLTQLLAQAKKYVVIAAPFIQSGYGLSSGTLADALRAALRRGVNVDVVSTGQSLQTLDVAWLRQEAQGILRLFQPKANFTDEQRLGSHAKFCVADGRSAYVGSANLTGPGLSKHLEMGLLIQGDVARQIVMGISTCTLE